MPEVDAGVKAGISLYSKFLLSIYDWYLLGYCCRFLWKCPARNMLALYDEHVSGNHLDIGVGTGYFMDRCAFPTPHPHITLMDLSENSLGAARKRLARYQPEAVLGNALEPFDLGGRTYDSIGMMNLLHCLPGDMTTKSVVLDHAKAALNPGGTLFGSTIFYKGAKRSVLATLTMKTVNRRGYMTNLEDDIVVLADALRRRFAASEVKTIGCMALFHATVS